MHYVPQTKGMVVFICDKVYWGYTEEVTAVFTANQQVEKASEFPYLGEEDTDGPIDIDG